MYLLFLLHGHYEINTVMVGIFVFDTRVTEQRSGMMKNCGKNCKEKGREQREVFKNKDGFQNRNERTKLYLQNKIKRNLFQTSSVLRSSISYS